MITEILRFTSKQRVEQILVEKYVRWETLHMSTHLHEQNVDEYIDEIKQRFLEEKDDLTLLVVKYIPPEENSYDPTHSWYDAWKMNNKNVWGFKIINPKKR